MFHDWGIRENTMNLDNALTILERNDRCLENSMIYDLHEECTFSVEHFWDYYDSVMTLAIEALIREKTIEIAMKIAFVYQYFLKEIIYHFDEQDGVILKNFPSNYTEYIERVDGALGAYFRGVFIEESNYRLERSL